LKEVIDRDITKVLLLRGERGKGFPRQEIVSVNPNTHRVCLKE